MSKTSRSPAQSWAAAGSPRPIVVIGGGSIVSDAHLPAYRLAGLPVAGLFDLDAERTRKVAAEWDITPFANLEEAVATENAIFDLALPLLPTAA
nr:Gfo/Idh/MocA family oxidoreductase [Marinicella sp. W31]MDC2878437.1 Gfo/Idh/MocA family oxidoreductase [Marinicella sp. W31]